MKDINLLPVNIRRALEYCTDCEHIDEDIVMCTFDDVPLPTDNRQMECVLVGLITGGEGRYSVGAVEHQVKANDVIIVGDGQVLGDVQVTKKLSGELLLISHDFLYNVIRDVHDVSNLFVFSREHPVFPLEADEVLMAREYLSLLRMKVKNDRHLFRRQIVGTLLAAMIYELCNSTSTFNAKGSQRQSRSQEVFGRFIKLVEDNFREERRVSWYSQQIGVSPKTLLEMVKRVSQRTPNEWLDIYTTVEIRLQLRHTAKPIGEIARDLHFGTQSSLGKFFKEHVGVSPTSYRQS